MSKNVLERKVSKFILKLSRKVGVKPPKVKFLNRIPPRLVPVLKARREYKRALKYGGMYYNPRTKTINILPNTVITKELLAHEFAHHVQNVGRKLKPSRAKSKRRRRVEEEADELAKKLLS